MKAVLWDLDDTLLETLPARMRALKHAYETCVGGWVDPVALWRSHRGGTLEALAQRLVGGDYARFARIYREHYYAEGRRGQPYDGVREVLDACREHGLAQGVVTSKVSWGATEELEAAGILGYFGAVVGYDDTELHKPDPEPVFAAMARLLVDEADEVLFVGDSPADVFAARNAGAVAAAALWGTLDEELLLDAAPQHIARRPDDVLDALRAELTGAAG